MLGTTSNDTLMLLIQTMQQQMKQDREQQQQHTAQLVAAVNEAMKEKKSHQPPKLPPIRGDKSVEHDFHRFEQHMETYEIPKKLWAAELHALLMEEGLAVYRQILPADINNYEAIKDTLLRQSGIHPHTHIQQLLQCSPKPGATATRFYGAAKQVLRILQQGLTYDQLIDKLSLEITFRAAQPHIVHFVRVLKHAKLQEAIDEMDQYIATRELDQEKLWNHSNPKPKQPWTSRHPNPFSTLPSSVHTTCTDSAQRPSKLQTQLTNTRKQTFTERLPHKLAKYFDAEKGPMCFNCKKWGHLTLSGRGQAHQTSLCYWLPQWTAYTNSDGQQSRSFSHI